jgi:hypothetical protein
MAAPSMLLMGQRLAGAGILALWLSGSPSGEVLQVPQTSQTITGEIVGTISDSFGAVMPGATVTARGTKTAKVPTVVTNQAGEFQIANLADDSYVVTAALSGFPASARSVDVRDGARVDLGVIKMSLGNNVIVDTIETPNPAAMGLSPGDVPVSVTTSAGNFDLVVATKAAPEAAGEFLKRVDGHSYDGGRIVPLLAIEGQQAQGVAGLELVMNPESHPEQFRAVIAGDDLVVEPGRKVFGRVWRSPEREAVVSKIRLQPLSGRSFAVPVTIVHVSRI